MATLALPLSAKAQTACQMIDHVTQSVAIAQTAGNAKSLKEQRDATLTLEPVLDRISTPALLPSEVRQSLPGDSQAIIRYVSSLREAVEAAKTGHMDFAVETLSGALGPDMANGVTSLASYWNCNPNSNAPTLGSGNLLGSADAASGTNESAPLSNKRVQSVGDGSNLRDRSGERSSGDGSHFRNNVVVEGNIVSFMMMLGLMALTGLFVFLYRQRKRFRAREARRVLNRPIPVRIGEAESELLLVDISMNGAKLQHPGGLEGERRIDLNLNGLWHSAFIKWSNPLFAGVMFKTPLDESELKTIIE